MSGCDLCGDFPVALVARCHPTAPLRVAMPEPGVLVLYCYLPECNREVTRLKLAEDGEIERLRALAAELLAGCKTYHHALDVMFGMMIERTMQDSQPFFPSKSGQPWTACSEGFQLIARAGRALGDRK